MNYTLSTSTFPTITLDARSIAGLQIYNVFDVPPLTLTNVLELFLSAVKDGLGEVTCSFFRREHKAFAALIETAKLLCGLRLALKRLFTYALVEVYNNSFTAVLGDVGAPGYLVAFSARVDFCGVGGSCRCRGCSRAG